MRLVITGAAGMLGQDLAGAAVRAGHDVTALSRGELDVTDADAVAAALERARPEVVANCAAWTDVDGAEEDPEGALRLNGQAAGAVALEAATVGAAVLHISTDYVFDGRKGSPYVESDPVDPQSSYGRSKLAGERAVAEANPRHWIARTSWLFGVGGANFVETMLRLAGERDEVSVVDDQVGCPTWTGHLAEGLLELAGRGEHGVHHLASSGSTSWHGFAERIFERSGAGCRALPCATADMPRPAPRPAYSVLGSERQDAVRLPSWEDGLDGYLAARSVAA